VHQNDIVCVQQFDKIILLWWRDESSFIT